MKRLIWDVQFLSPPYVLHYCKKCGQKTEHFNSGNFRVNAQGKYLDIWLIYKCIKCDTTWNLAIFSRIKPTDIDPHLLNRYYNNDSDLAMQHGCSTALMRKNEVEVYLPPHQIDGPDVPHNIPVELQIRSRYSLPLKATAILRQKLQLSHHELEKLIENGQIQHISQKPLKKCRLNDELKLFIHLI